MADAVCPLCKSKNNHPVFPDNSYVLTCCEDCGLFFIHPYPGAAEDTYQVVATYDFDEMKTLSAEKKRRAEIQFYTEYWPKLQPQLEGVSSVLDVGCGCGRLLELLADRPDVYRAGIELNEERAGRARQIANCEIHEVPIEQFASDRKFDAITMINVLSHIPYFDALFKSVRGLLSERGKLIIETGELAPDTKKSDLYDWGIPDHVHFLGLKTLDFICEKYGYEIVEHQRISVSEELFSRARWKSPARSVLRSVIKKVVVCTPFALSAIAGLYRMRHGTRINSSFIVLRPC